MAAAAVVASGRIIREKWIKLGGGYSFFFVVLCCYFFLLFFFFFFDVVHSSSVVLHSCAALDEVPFCVKSTSSAVGYMLPTLGLIVLDRDIRWERDVVKGY